MTSSERRTFQERGFPYASYPSGWFQIGWSDALKAGDVTALHFFGREMVLFRTAAGRPVVMQAYCPHFGAHFAHGGRVEGECIRCPYHGWTWTADGANAHIPYGPPDRIEARAKTWPVADSSGIIFLWNDDTGAAPSWPVPVIGENADPNYHRPIEGWRHNEVMSMHPQMAAENFPDVVHLKFVHGFTEIPDPEFVYEGPIVRTRFPSAFDTPRGPIPIDNISEAFGVGLNVARFRDGVDVTVVGGFTPIDQTSSMGFASTWVRKRTPDEAAPSGVGAAVAKEGIQQLFGPHADRPIFENSYYRTRPLCIGKEAPRFAAFRRWAAQFYPADHPAAETLALAGQ